MLPDDFSENMEVREKWDSIFRVLREKIVNPRIIYSEKLFLKTEWEIKTFQDKNWELFANRHALGVFQALIKGNWILIHTKYLSGKGNSIGK